MHAPSSRPASEEEFLALIDVAFPTRHPHMIIGRGDDCALIQTPGRLVVTTDLFLEDVHFRRSYFTPAEIGRKALAVNLSDLAAMGSRPLGFSLALAAPADLDTAFLAEMLGGMAHLASRFDTALTGGDVSRSRRLGLSITAWGAAGPRVLRRQAAVPGDVLFTVGPVGLARAGLLALEEAGRAALAAWPEACAAHLSPEPLVEAGLALAAMEAVRGAMDVSDGLAKDLPRFLGPGLGADLDPAGLDPPAEVLGFCRERGLDPAVFAVQGGEDYALLAAALPGAMDRVCSELPGVRVLGRVRGLARGRAGNDPVLRLGGAALARAGYDHFSIP